MKPKTTVAASAEKRAGNDTDSAMRAVFRGQPFNMLRPENYELWKDIEVTFDPRDMIRG